MAGGSRRPVVGVDGLNTLKRTLKQAAGDVQDLKDAHARVANLVAGRARAATPIGPPALHLRDSVRGAGQAGAAVIRAGFASLPYANPIHWGWPARHIAAQPFIWNAIADTQSEWLDMYVTDLQTIIDKVEGAPGP
jgi:hypothetical protein